MSKFLIDINSVTTGKVLVQEPSAFEWTRIVFGDVAVSLSLKDLKRLVKEAQVVLNNWSD